MAEKNSLFAFVVGEVAKSFYGRLDLTKYSIGLAHCENFFIDYKGGAVFRPGSRFIAAFTEGEIIKTLQFRTAANDLILLFRESDMLVMSDGALLLGSASYTVSPDEDGRFNATAASVGAFVHFSAGSDSGYFYVRGNAGQQWLESATGYIPKQAGTMSPVYSFAHGLTLAVLRDGGFYQDINRLVITHNSMFPKQMLYAGATAWSISAFGKSLPAAPSGQTATPSAAGSASAKYYVTTVLDGIESERNSGANCNDMVNISTTTGHVTVTWTAVPGADSYRIYRTLIQPISPVVAGMQAGYIGESTGVVFRDMNITPDFTKLPPESVNYFAGGNNPDRYCRFQQRGVFGGLKNEPLTVVGTDLLDRELFTVNSPVLATDSYKYTADGQYFRPIKHMLPLRYGLLLFTDDMISQLRGAGDSSAVTANAANLETQSYTSVSDLTPVAVNLDVLYMTAFGTEFNTMMYTEYTNSFKTADILVLSSHLFGTGKQAKAIVSEAEPHKLLNFVREDGARVTLTYERSQEVYGWSWHSTQGKWLDLAVARDATQTSTYYIVRRWLNGRFVDCVEQQLPLETVGYEKQWFVDCGLSRELAEGPETLTLVAAGDESWTATGSSSDLSYLQEGWRLYIGRGLFVVEEAGATATLRCLDGPHFDNQIAGYPLGFAAGEWRYGAAVTEVSGLWHLEGKVVSVQADGDADVYAVVQNGKVSLPNEALSIIIGLGYTGRCQTLPLALANTNVSGIPLALRGAAFRQQNSRGLAVGTSFDNVEELPSRSDEGWDNPLRQYSELTITQLYGGSGWGSDASICFVQRYPLSASVLGITYNLDVGED